MPNMLNLLKMPNMPNMLKMPNFLDLPNLLDMPDLLSGLIKTHAKIARDAKERNFPQRRRGRREVEVEEKNPRPQSRKGAKKDVKQKRFDFADYEL